VVSEAGVVSGARGGEFGVWDSGAGAMGPLALSPVLPPPPQALKNKTQAKINDFMILILCLYFSIVFFPAHNSGLKVAGFKALINFFQ
jgi:hypothetical protein